MGPTKTQVVSHDNTYTPPRRQREGPMQTKVSRLVPPQGHRYAATQTQIGTTRDTKTEVRGHANRVRPSPSAMETQVRRHTDGGKRLRR